MLLAGVVLGFGEQGGQEGAGSGGRADGAARAGVRSAGSGPAVSGDRRVVAGTPVRSASWEIRIALTGER
ncbi:hypothetical protein GCM10010428_25660 [Actinosynnema pretiosum subsp. pretiosum]